jgi:hypothetical protein
MATSPSEAIDGAAAQDDGLRRLSHGPFGRIHVTREQLLELRDALDQTLSWPDHVREAIGRWLVAPPAAKPNGAGAGAGQDRLKVLDEALAVRPAAPANPEPAPRSTALTQMRHPTPVPYAGKARRGGKPATSATAAEERLLDALRSNSGASVAALAEAASAGKTMTAERLQRLASRGLVTKDNAGRWRLVEEMTKGAGAKSEPETRPIPAPSTN